MIRHNYEEPRVKTFGISMQRGVLVLVDSNAPKIEEDDDPVGFDDF